MIFLDRDQFPIPSALDLSDPTSKAAEELKDGIDRLGSDNPINGTDFKAYKNKEIRKALTEMSYGKCAYYQ